MGCLLPYKTLASLGLAFNLIYITMDDDDEAVRVMSRWLSSRQIATDGLFPNALGSTDVTRIIARMWYQVFIIPLRSMKDTFLHFFDQVPASQFRVILPPRTLNRRMNNPINFSMFERTAYNLHRNEPGVWPEISQHSVTGRMISELFYPMWRETREFMHRVSNWEGAGPDGRELNDTGTPHWRWRPRHFGSQFRSIGDAAGRTKSWYHIAEAASGREFQIEAIEQMQLYKPGN